MVDGGIPLPTDFLNPFRSRGSGKEGNERENSFHILN